MQRLDVVRVDGVLHDLQPVARQHRVADVADAVHHVRLVARQLGGRVVADVGPHHAAQRLGLAGLDAHPLAERRRRVGLGEDVDALAVGVELPAVVAAAQAAVLDDAVHERGAAVRAAFVGDPVRAVGQLEHGEVLAQQSRPLDRELVELANERHRVPVVAQHVAHRRARPDPGQLVVLLLASSCGLSPPGS